MEEAPAFRDFFMDARKQQEQQQKKERIDSVSVSCVCVIGYGAVQIRAKNVQFAAQHCSLLQLHVTDLAIVFNLKSTKPKIRRNIK